ncbi:MAG: peptidase-C39 like family protein, partial [Nitrospinae bacterium]|nr:peptidase-C39 like family protein [Nitrospinota bacterium]
LTGLSSTYLYGSVREYSVGVKSTFDDIKGYPTGHFVLVSGYDPEEGKALVADPYRNNPMAEGNYYRVKIRRLFNAIMLGIITHDANLLIIQPKE